MKITPHNESLAIEMLRARAFLLIMSDECSGIDGEHAAALFEIVGDMDQRQAHEAIEAFDATQ